MPEMRQRLDVPQVGQRTRLLLLLAALSFAPALAFYYVGEEAIFPITSLEMWHQREWIQQPLFGGSLMHNPLYNWLIIPFAALIGWEYMLPVARALTIAATLGTAAVLAWLAARLSRRTGAPMTINQAAQQAANARPASIRREGNRAVPPADIPALLASQPARPIPQREKNLLEKLFGG